MGKPKFSRKKYDTPSHPWQEDRIKAENELTKKYGLKNKREVWKAETALRKYRGQARELLAKIGGGDAQIKKESDQLLMHLTRMNILPPNSTLDDVLALETESILSRRLQTLAYLKGLANTPVQARQLISHGHVYVNGRKLNISDYCVKLGDKISLKDSAKSSGKVKQQLESNPNFTVQSWLQLSREKPEATIVALPTRDDIQVPVEELLVVEFCSR